MVLILDGNLEHDVHARRKTGIFGETALRLNKCLGECASISELPSNTMICPYPEFQYPDVRTNILPVRYSVFV